MKELPRNEVYTSECWLAEPKFENDDTAMCPRTSS
jgi:hypothetical protein